MAGFTLEDVGERVSWRAVLNYAKHAGPDTAIYRVTHGSDGAWSLEAQLLALMVDVLNVANYQRGGGKGQRPKQIPRPGVNTEGRFGRAAVAATDFDDFWSTAGKVA